MANQINTYMREMIISAKFLIETPLAKLYNDTINGFATPRRQSAGRVQVMNKLFIAASRNNAVGIKATTRSSANKYDTQMFFEGIEYLDAEEDGTKPFGFTASDGQAYIIEAVNYNSDDVKVSCSCLDFYYRFSVWNNRDGSLYGNPPPPYVNKTDGREPVNPDKIAGLCKHLISLTDELRQERFLG